MTIHYHGTPITGLTDEQKEQIESFVADRALMMSTVDANSQRQVIWQLMGRFFCVSHFRPDQVAWCHKYGQGVMLDNGAFSYWRNGKEKTDWSDYYAWTDEWLAYPTSWAVIPDVITGDAAANDALIKQWPHGQRGAPVWHMHEPLERLQRLCDEWQRVCIGSSAEYAEVGADNWHRRMCEAMNLICRTGRVPTWLHMLRGMAAARWGYPFASVDSTDIARNHNRPQNGARKMADIWDSIQCSPHWKAVPQQVSLLGEAA